MNSLFEPLLDSGRVARLLGVEKATLAAWRRRGYGPRWFRIGKKVKYAEPDLHAWMIAQAWSKVAAISTTPAGGPDR